MLQPLYSAEQMRTGEQQAATAAGVSMRQLMSAAGQAVFQQVQQCFPHRAELAVCCGEGNNGGDGYIVARLAQQAGYRVKVFALKPNRTLTSPQDNDAEAARQAWRDESNTELPLTELQPQQFDGVIDALFGNGLSRPLEDEALDWVRRLNCATTPVLAVDIPSGIAADTGQVLGAAVAATWTVTMIGLKRGMVTGAAVHYCGQVSIAELGIASELERFQPAQWHGLDDAWCRQWLPERQADSHKGDNGHVLIVGGNQGMSGAVRLSAEAALRGGAGKVSVACHPQVVTVVASDHAEAMVHGVVDGEALAGLLASATVVIIGPGLGQDDWAKAMFDAVLAANKPTLIDADGLNLISQRQTPPALTQVIITPHPGEAGRLLAQETAAVEHDRFTAVRELRQRYQADALLKGAGSVVACQCGQYVITRGSPAMASGGMGDCLSGLIGALWAQGMASAQALLAGSYWHAVAGELAAKDGIRGTLASDLMVPIRQLVNAPSEGESGSEQ